MNLIDKIAASLFQNGVDVKVIKGKLRVNKDDKQQVRMFLHGFIHAPEILEQIEFV